MSHRSETFGRLLKGAINSIAAYEGKTAPAVEEELGAQIGVAGSAIQRYKAGNLPPEPRATQILAEAAVRRGFLSRAWLLRFLQAARYPTPETLVAQLADVLGTTARVAPSALPSGTLAFLFTDIAGSTMLWEQQPQAMERALARHDAILRQTIDAYGGHVFKTVGDAFYAVFTTAPDALDAALAAQRTLRGEAWGSVGPITIRAAIHIGTAQQRDDDYFGPPLNRVARLCAAGHPGQILVSNATQELVRDALPSGIELRDLGEHRLKDLARPERVFQVVASDLPCDFPPLHTLDRYRHNLPAQPTPLIGREAEVAEVRDIFRSGDTRLLTLTGPGGTGKTRLALQAAAELLDDFRDGVLFVALAPIHDPALVLVTIAQALGVIEAAGQTLADQLKSYLRPRQTLLLLDNFEHVASAAPLIAELLAAASELKVMVTSRETLHIYGEHEYAVPPLRLPDLRRLPPIERLTQYEAVRLFIERAQAVRSDFAITTETAPIVAEICARLDGLPLAIELAAARSKVFPPHALLARLDKRLRLLTGGPRDLPARQQTLSSAIAWSYDLLDVTEQAIFARLAVFDGGCTLEAAEAVLGDDGQAGGNLAAHISPMAVLDGLASLIDKNLLKQTDSEGGEPRFWTLETIREFALERLHASGEADGIRRRHAQFFATLAQIAEPHLRDSEQRVWFDRLDTELGNVRAALGWSLTADVELGLRLASPLTMFAWVRGHLNEWLRWIEAGLQQSNKITLATRAHAIYALALPIEWQLGDHARALACVEESLTLFRDLGDQGGIASSLEAMGWIVVAQGDQARAVDLFSESLALFRSLEDKRGCAECLNGLGWTIGQHGDTTQAAEFLQESLQLHQELGDRRGIAVCLHNLAWVMHRQSNAARANALFIESMALHRELGFKQGIADCLVGLAVVAGTLDQPERAVRLLGTAEAGYASISSKDRGHYPDDYHHTIASLRAQLGEEAYTAAFDEGKLLTPEQVLVEALTPPEAPAP